MSGTDHSQNPDFAAYVKMSRAMFRIFETYSPDIYQYSIDEAFLDMTGMESLLGPPEETAARLKNQIRDTPGLLTVNVGISSNLPSGQNGFRFLKSRTRYIPCIPGRSGR